jgi:pimeloyl-ACP methyl ester carboxylesterase
MPYFDSEDITLNYLDEGDGEPILLVHGFASNIDTNWVHTGWVKTLLAAGRRVVAIDNRGHGQSEKLYDPAYYPSTVMADDAANLISHLGFTAIDVMGYSMGARICAFLALQHPAAVRSAVFGGLGQGMIDGVGAPGPIVDALEARNKHEVTDPTGRAFREFAEQTGSDLLALAACMRASRQRISIAELNQISCPVLVAVGSRDTIGGSAQGLAQHLSQGRAFEIANRDHMVAVGDRTFKSAVVEFLRERHGAGR